MCLNIGIPKILNFPFGTNGKLMVLGVPILKHIKVFYLCCSIFLLSGRCGKTDRDGRIEGCW